MQCKDLECNKKTVQAVEKAVVNAGCRSLMSPMHSRTPPEACYMIWINMSVKCAPCVRAGTYMGGGPIVGKDVPGIVADEVEEEATQYADLTRVSNC